MNRDLDLQATSKTMDKVLGEGEHMSLHSRSHYSGSNHSHHSKASDRELLDTRPGKI